MPFQKVEYSFPDEVEENFEIEIEPSSAKTIDLSGNAKAEPKAEAAEPEVLVDDDDDEYEIEIVDDAPAQDDDDVSDDVTEEELGDYSKKVQKRINKLTAQRREAAREKEAILRERQELETFTKQLMEKNKELQNSVIEGQEAALEQAKRTAAGEAILAKRAYKQAYEAGDADKLIEAQEKLTNAKIKADRLNALKPPALQEDENPVQTRTEEQITAPVPVDERANSWAASNTWFGQDDEMTSLALGLHTKLVKLGIDPQSSEYYEQIDPRMKQVFPEQFEGQGEVANKPKRQSNIVAPATRSTAPKKITLSPTQVALAKRLGLTPKQYALQAAIDMRKQ